MMSYPSFSLYRTEDTMPCVARISTPVRGVTLLVAVILSSVVLSVAMALLDVAYKQQLLASTAKQSQVAFYNADSAMECALYWDQQKSAFDYSPPPSPPSITCNNGTAVANQNPVPTTVAGVGPIGGLLRKTTFDIPCSGGGIQGSVTVFKSDGTSVCTLSGSHTCIFVTGYSSCSSSDPRRIERGLKVLF